MALSPDNFASFARCVRDPPDARKAPTNPVKLAVVHAERNLANLLSFEELQVRGALMVHSSDSVPLQIASSSTVATSRLHLKPLNERHLISTTTIVLVSHAARSH